MRELDINNSVAITRDIFWTGFYEESSKLHCNPYLLIDNEDVVVFDPGSIPDFPVVMRKMIDHVNPSEISLIVVSHQDPDVCGNLAVLENLIERDDLKVAAHTNTIRLIQHLGIESEFYPVEKNNNEIILKSGRKLEFIFVPFLHSPGAIVTYDTETKSLFTGDIFGTKGDDWSLFAGGEGF
ncbi:MBL fold metallo-hydrolase, partial [Myxococcota bacterium]|nr:MBL fold metallo-hydrolase [Myxococcota bacterium]